MIVKLSIDPTAYNTYHTEDHLTDSVEKVTRIKDTQHYKDIKSSIDSEGVKDPVIVRVEPKRILVEVGETRVLAARELGFLSIPALAYNTLGGKIDFDYDKKITTLTDLEKEFTTEREIKDSDFTCTNKDCPHLKEYDFPKVISTVDKSIECSARAVREDAPGLKMLKDYLAAKIASF